MNKTVKLVLAVVFFIISYIEAQDAMTSQSIAVKTGTFFDWTTYVWALCPALLGCYLIWSAFMTRSK